MWPAVLHLPSANLPWHPWLNCTGTVLHCKPRELKWVDPSSLCSREQTGWVADAVQVLVWYILPIVIVLPFLASHWPHLPRVFHISSISVPPWAWCVSFSSPLQWYFLTSLTWSYFYFQFVVHEPILAIFLAFSGLLYKHLYYFAVLYCSCFYICIQ